MNLNETVSVLKKGGLSVGFLNTSIGQSLLKGLSEYKNLLNLDKDLENYRKHINYIVSVFYPLYQLVTKPHSVDIKLRAQYLDKYVELKQKDITKLSKDEITILNLGAEKNSAFQEYLNTLREQGTGVMNYLYPHQNMPAMPDFITVTSEHLPVLAEQVYKKTLEQAEVLESVSNPGYENFLIPLANLTDNIAFLVNYSDHFYLGDISQPRISHSVNLFKNLIDKEVFNKQSLYDNLLRSDVNNNPQAEYIQSRLLNAFQSSGMHLNEKYTKELYEVRDTLNMYTELYQRITAKLPSLDISNLEEIQVIDDILASKKSKNPDGTYSIPRSLCLHLSKVVTHTSLEEKFYDHLWFPPNIGIEVDGTEYMLDEVIKKINSQKKREGSILSQGEGENYADWLDKIHPLDIRNERIKACDAQRQHSFGKYKKAIIRKLPCEYDGNIYEMFDDIPVFLREKIFLKDNIILPKSTYQDELLWFFGVAKSVFGIDISKDNTTLYLSNPPAKYYKVSQKGKLLGVLSIDLGEENIATKQRNRYPRAFHNALLRCFNQDAQVQPIFIHLNIPELTDTNISDMLRKSLWHEGFHALESFVADGSLDKYKNPWEYEIMSQLGEWIGIYQKLNHTDLSEEAKSAYLKQKIEEYHYRMGAQCEWELLSLLISKEQEPPEDLFHSGSQRNRIFRHIYKSNSTYYGAYDYPISASIAFQIVKKLFTYNASTKHYEINEDIVEKIKAVMMNKQCDPTAGYKAIMADGE